MSFTDDDLKRLKSDLEKHIVIDLIQDQGLSLLARMDAAERGIFDLETVVRWMREEKRYEKLSAADLVWLQSAEFRLKAWREAAGN